MKPGLSLRVSQHLALTPQLQQSIKLLQLSTLELEQEVEQMLDDNPFLERLSEEAPREEFGLDPEGGPLFIVVSRLTRQKGLDMLLEALPGLVARGGQLAVLGTGEPDLQEGFLRAAARWPGRIGTRIGYDEALSHRMFAGGDVVLVPSRFEPSGLTQMYGLAYGTLPLVARTGGLADSVIDANVAALRDEVATGLQFAPITAHSLNLALQKVSTLYAQPDIWQRMTARAMAHPVGWDASARDYAALYDRLTGR